PLHPIFEWVNDRASVLFGRHEAPIMGVPTGLSDDEFIFVVAGTIPNRKSTPVVDEWFGLRYRKGRLIEEMSIDQIMSLTGYDRGDLPNRGALEPEQIRAAENLLPNVVRDALRVLERHYQAYKETIDPKI